MSPQPRQSKDKTRDAEAAKELLEAMAYEEEIGVKAAAIRGDAEKLTPGLFLELLPLLRSPIPGGFVKFVPKLEKGKPYPSTGVKSVQVLVNRMDNVLTPLWWRESREYEKDGALCCVTVSVRNRGEEPFVSRSSMGGVDRASTTGNLYKGSYTNAAKLAFARVGPGHEVYLGATDLDPDVNEDAAAAQGAEREKPGKSAGKAKRITKQRAEALVKAAGRAGVMGRLQLAASHVFGDDVGDCSTAEAAAEALVRLNTDQATKVREWIDRKASEVLG